VMGFSSRHQMHAEPPGRSVGCSHFSRQHHGDLGPHHAAATHTRRRSSEAAQQEHVVWQGIAAGNLGLSSYVLVAISLAPPRQVGGGASPAGCARPLPLRRSPPMAPRRRAHSRSWFGSLPSRLVWSVITLWFPITRNHFY
jgi:hypothetical protein